MKIAMPAKGGNGKNPFTVICYLCGKEFGSKSIVIHERSCGEAWDLRNSARPKSQQLERPVRPVNIGGSGELSGKGRDAYNTAAMEEFVEASLAPCAVCNRRFTDTALAHHERACRPGGYFARHAPPTEDEVQAAHEDREEASTIPPPIKPKVPKNHSVPGQGRSISPVPMIPCTVCHRQFHEEALTIHMRSCKAGGYFDTHRSSQRKATTTGGSNGNLAAMAPSFGGGPGKVIVSKKGPLELSVTNGGNSTNSPRRGSKNTNDTNNNTANNARQAGNTKNNNPTLPKTSGSSSKEKEKEKPQPPAPTKSQNSFFSLFKKSETPSSAPSPEANCSTCPKSYDEDDKYCSNCGTMRRNILV